MDYFLQIYGTLPRAGPGSNELTQDMKEMVFPASSFDIIWSEGAIYNLGFETGLKKVKEFVKPGGDVAVSEAVRLKPDPPPEVVEFWREYPEIDTVAAKLEVIRHIGYEVVDHFIFPPTAWTKHYYDPMEERIAEKAEDWSGIPDAEAVLKEAQNEISIFRRHFDYFSDAFFVMRN